MRVVFIDRDGVINENRDDYVKSWAEFRFLPGALDALRLLTGHGFQIFVVTNQAGVNRRLIEPCTLADIHGRMIAAARRHGAHIRDVRHCPHRPDEGCGCRKPEPGMLYSLARAHDLDLSGAYLVGDAASDIRAGQLVGCRTALVRTGRGRGQLSACERGCPPDIVVDDLMAAAGWICGVERLDPRGLALREDEGASGHGEPCPGVAGGLPSPC